MVTKQRIEEIAETRRQWVNERLREMEVEHGITKHSDRSMVQALRAIDALRHTPTLSQGEKMLIALANWHPPCSLSQYKAASEEYERDYNQYGVYVLIELVSNEYVPRFVEAIPRYVGESTILSSRLRQHATGRSSTPAERVTQEYLQTRPLAERRSYEEAVASDRQDWRASARAYRETCMDRRGLLVRTVHTESKAEAHRLEVTLTRLYEGNGIHLWGKIDYHTTPPWH